MHGRTLLAAIDAVARTAPSRLALASPFQPAFLAMDYGRLSELTRGVAHFLRTELGYQKGNILVSDLPNTAENLLLQLSCGRLGVAYAAVKDQTGLAALQTATEQGVRGVVSTSPDSFLSAASLQHPAIFAESGLGGLSLGEVFGAGTGMEDQVLDGEDEFGSDVPWGYYNTTKPLTHGEIATLGGEIAQHLDISSDDKVCVSITLCHAFGIASACGSTLLSGGSVVLPAVGGIRGCGVPAQRAEATLETLVSEKCTLMFADTHTLKALPSPKPGTDLSALRGGVCKIGSGSDILPDKVDCAGVMLATVGKRAVA